MRVTSAGAVRRLSVLRRLRRTQLGRRLARYTAGSILATIVGQSAFLLVYGVVGAGPRTSSVIAFLAGFLPNYHLNRTWTWGRRGRSSLRGEVLPYVTVIAFSITVASVVTGFVETHAAVLTSSRPVRVALVTLAFAAVNGALFIGKFVVFDRLLFADGAARPRAARDQGSGSQR